MHLPSTLYVYLLSLLPSFEGRYAIIVGAGMRLDAAQCMAAATLGVATLSLTLPYILPLIDGFMEVLSEGKVRVLGRIAELYLEYVGRARRRASRYMDKYGLIGLIVFVAIPLPGTGIWTGSLAAYVLGMEREKTIPALLVGGILSNLITFLPLYAAFSLGGML